MKQIKVTASLESFPSLAHVNSKIFVGILFSPIALKDTLVM